MALLGMWKIMSMESLRHRFSTRVPVEREARPRLCSPSMGG
jgi:hypothetical protein